MSTFQEYDITVNISLREACLGTKKHIRMNMEVPCGDCNGTGAKGGPAGMQVIFLLNFSQILLKLT